MIELCAIDYRVGGATILRGVDLAFRRGRLNVLLGPNGAGKSTALRIAAGLLSPSAGSVLLDGRPLASFDALTLARRRALLSQHVEMPFALAAEDVVLMGRYPHYGRTPAPRDRAVVDEALGRVEMTEKRRQAYPTLSGGEQQKIQLARVLAQIQGDDEQPRVLLLDEPTASLDVHYQIHLLELARGLVASGCTVIATLHDLNLALDYGDSFFVLEQGAVALTCDDARDVEAALLERVFRVHAERVHDPATGAALWRFGPSTPPAAPVATGVRA